MFARDDSVLDAPPSNVHAFGLGFRASPLEVSKHHDSGGNLTVKREILGSCEEGNGFGTAALRVSYTSAVPRLENVFVGTLLAST